MSLPTIFISYSHRDAQWCQEFVATLESEGFSVWLDTNSLVPAASFVHQIELELQQRDIYIIILSPEALASEWVQREFELALASNRTILPVLLKPIPIVGQSHGFLSMIQQIDVQGQNGITAARTVLPRLTSSSAPPPTIGISQKMLILPESLFTLGFRIQYVNGYGVIVPPLCDVAAGAFPMGYDAAQPPMLVEVAAFAITKYPVTVAEYACAARVRDVSEGRELGDFDWKTQLRRQDRPVVCVTWQNAVDYAAWLSRLTGKVWRLPTEAEWEKAACWDRQTSRPRTFPWGDEWDKQRANTSDGGQQSASPVGAYGEAGASACGAEDMAGNVWEWCLSRYQSYPYHEGDGRNEAQGSGGRVVRGGSWRDHPRMARTAYRNFEDPLSFYDHRGFRLVCEAAARP